MDAIDRRILACLKENARANATEIGSRISLSTSAVIERIKKLESSGIIKGYTVLVDEKLTGTELTAFINVRLDHPKYYENFVSVIKSESCVTECYYIAGDFDFILKTIVRSGKTLEDILNNVKSIHGVSLTRTSVVLSTNKREVSVLPD